MAFEIISTISLWRRADMIEINLFAGKSANLWFQTVQSCTLLKRRLILLASLGKFSCLSANSAKKLLNDKVKYQNPIILTPGKIFTINALPFSIKNKI